MYSAIDTVEISRIEKLLTDLDEEGLRDFFSEDELKDAGTSGNRAQKLAARFAAKEACSKLFSREICLGIIEPVDFFVEKDGYGSPRTQATDAARAVMDRYRVGEIAISLTHTPQSATAVATPLQKPIEVPWYGKWLYHILPVRRRIVRENLDIVFGETLSPEQRKQLAQAYYAHWVKFFGEFLMLPFCSGKKREQLVRIEGGEHLLAAREQGRGVLILTGHFGNWEVATVIGIARFKEYFGLFHFIRKPLKPKWFNDFVMRRFRKAGFGTLEKSGSLDDVLELLEQNHIVVSIFDQFAIRNHGISSEFFGHRAHTFKSLAVLAQFTGAPVLPSSSWREPDGTHVLKFEAPVKVVTEGSTREIIKKNTKLFNEALERIILRNPEQWIWMHKRWKPVAEERQKTAD